MQLDELNRNIYTVFRKNDFKISKKLQKLKVRKTARFYRKALRVPFKNFAIGFKGFFLDLHDKLILEI